jgi:hypothetical protein
MTGTASGLIQINREWFAEKRIKPSSAEEKVNLAANMKISRNVAVRKVAEKCLADPGS